MAAAAPTSTTIASRELEWVRPPHQARSQKTLERILDSAETLISRKGFEAASVSEITRAARSSVGAFYSRFQDKEGLLHYVHERFIEQALATAEAALQPARWEGVGISEMLDQIIRFLIRVYDERRGLLLTFQQRIRTDPDMAERGYKLNFRIAELLHGLLLERTGQLSHPDLKRAVKFAMMLIFGSLFERALAQDVIPSDLQLREEEFLEELQRALKSYFGVEPNQSI